MADYFTFLPDPLIILIISYLAFKEAARTSILSQRWRYLWRATKNIEFDESLFTTHAKSIEERERRRGNFIDFVVQWMLHYQEPVVEKFCLAFSNPREFLIEIENCVRFACSHGVRRLDLDFSDATWCEYNCNEPAPSFALPACVYKSGDLESLKLYSCIFHVPAFNTFTALKDLSLGWIELTSSSLNVLLVNCPLLESLSLKKCWSLDDPAISGECLKLGSLVMDKCAFVYQFTLAAPLLQSLTYSGAVSEFVLLNQPSVKKVELDFGLETDIDYKGIYGDVLRELLRDLKCTTLTVCSFLLQQLLFSSENLPLGPLLRGLTHLTVKVAFHDFESHGLAFLLSSCQRLQVLTVEIGRGVRFPDYGHPPELRGNAFWMQKEVISPCITETLKVVEMKGFTGEHTEINLVKYLLLHGRVMERLNIIVKREAGDKENTVSPSRVWAEMVQFYGKASPRLQISIS